MPVKYLLTMIVVAVFALPQFSRAQEAPPSADAPPRPSDAVLLATVNIYDAKIISQNGREITVAFDISNRQNIQPGIRYGVRLTKDPDDSETAVDETAYDETLVLGEYDTVSKEVKYEAPPGFSGTFGVWVISKNEKGLPLGINQAGEITLEETESIRIKEASCFLKVEGEGNKTYPPAYGVDIDSDEKLLASCEISSNFNGQIKTIPRFETLERSLYGNKLKEEKLSVENFSSGEKKVLTFEIPKAKDPQAYDAVLSFSDPNGRIISNRVAFHYVIRGLSATVQNLRLDKDYYKEGETAKATFNWTSSADMFFGSRMKGNRAKNIFLDVAISDQQGQLCGKAREEEIDTDSANMENIHIRIPIARDCLNPQVSAQVLDEKDQTLDELAFSVKSQNPSVKTRTGIVKKAVDKVKSFGMAFIIILVLISLALIIIKKKKGSLHLFVFVLFFLGSFLAAKDTKADTFTVPTYGIWPDGGAAYNGRSAVYSVNFNSSSYAPGATVTVNHLIQTYGGCNNNGARFGKLKVWNFQSSQWVDLRYEFIWQGLYAVPGYPTTPPAASINNTSLSMTAQANSGSNMCLTFSGENLHTAYTTYDDYNSWCGGVFSCFVQNHISGNSTNYNMCVPISSGGGGCTPNCSCAANTCTGSTCPNGCGGTCAGTRICSVANVPKKLEGECPNNYGEINVSWENGGGNVEYYLYIRSFDSEGGLIAFAGFYTPNTEYTWRYKPGLTYHVQVAGRNSSGVWSNYTDPIDIDCPEDGSCGTANGQTFADNSAFQSSYDQVQSGHAEIAQNQQTVAVTFPQAYQDCVPNVAVNNGDTFYRFVSTQTTKIGATEFSTSSPQIFYLQSPIPMSVSKDGFSVSTTLTLPGDTFRDFGGGNWRRIYLTPSTYPIDWVATPTCSSSFLCQTGTPSAISGTGPWSWTCSGVFGGTNASCQADIYTCQGSQPLSTMLCPDDNTGLTADSPYTPVASLSDCTSSTKCEYYPISMPCLCDPAEDANHCEGSSYVNACGENCNGTKDCYSGWKEVAP